MIVTWIGDIRPLLEKAFYEHCYRMLPAMRRDKADRLSRMEDKALSAGVWTLLERAREEFGFRGYPLYNLSHSFPYALCSFVTEDADVHGGVQLGCDVETVKTPRLSVASRYFRPQEYRYILEQPDEERQKQAFFRYWVLKESFLKATGRGMGLSMDSFEITIAEEGGSTAPVLTRNPPEYPGTYYFQEYQAAAPDARVAVCSTCPDFAPGLRYVEF